MVEKYVFFGFGVIFGLLLLSAVIFLNDLSSNEVQGKNVSLTLSMENQNGSFDVYSSKVPASQVFSKASTIYFSSDSSAPAIGCEIVCNKFN